MFANILFVYIHGSYFFMDYYIYMCTFLEKKINKQILSPQLCLYAFYLFHTSMFRFKYYY